MTIDRLLTGACVLATLGVIVALALAAPQLLGALAVIALVALGLALLLTGGRDSASQ